MALSRLCFGFASAAVSLAFAAVLTITINAVAYAVAPLRWAFDVAFPATVETPEVRHSIAESEIIDFGVAKARQRSFSDRLLARSDLQRRPTLALAA
jgi:hypothetical protein